MAKQIAVPPDDGRLPFLDAIRANPDDDAPRLVFADWLEERGEEVRARFIRLQIEQARLSHDEPRYWAIRRQLRPLEEKIRSQVFRGLPRPWFRSSTFERGFLRRLDTTTDYFLKAGAALLAREPLDELSLQAGRVNHPREVLASPLLLQISALGMTHSQLGNEGAKQLAESPNIAHLRSLDLTANYILVDGFAHLAASPYLSNVRSLTVKYNDAFAQGAKSLAESPYLKNLVYLDIGCNEIGPDGLAALANGTFAASLETLMLKGNPSYEPVLHDDGMRVLAEAKSFRNLRELDLQYNEITGQGLRYLAQAKSLRKLTRLSMAGNTFTNRSVEQLLDAPFLNQLEELDLRNSEMGNSGAMALGLARMPQLKKLNLGSCGIDRDGMIGLCAGDLLKNVLELSLDGNRLTNAGVTVLAHCPHLEHLFELNLADVGLQLAGLKSLANAKLPSLRHLTLDYNRIPPTGIIAMTRAPWLRQLRNLSLANIGIDVKAAQALAAVKPMSEIEHIYCRGPIPDAARKILKAQFRNKITIN